MDFKKFGRYIGILGLVIALFGAAKFFLNQPIKPKGGFASQTESLFENAQRKVEQSTAIRIASVGGIILFIGFAIEASGRKRNSSGSGISKG